MNISHVVWIKIEPGCPMPDDYQDVLIGWDAPRVNWKTGPRVASAVYRDYTTNLKGERMDLRMFRTPDGGFTVGRGYIECPSHWAVNPDPPRP